MTTRLNALSQTLDISGSTTQISNANIGDESLHLGFPVVGQTGTTASISTVSSNLVTISGLIGMNNNSITRFITISNANHSSNNGTFPIKSFISSNSIIYENAAGISSDSNNGFIHWVEREPYSLQDDLNYSRTDRTLIKGVNYDQNIPSYQRADATNVSIGTNLLNISNKTLDAKVQILDKKLSNISISIGNTFVTITDTGNFSHSSSVNLTGVPLFDVSPYQNNYNACYVGIFNKLTDIPISPLSNSNKRIFGLTRKGSSISPNSIEIEFRQVIKGNDLSTSTSYAWEIGQILIVDMYYGFGIRKDLLDPWAQRFVLTDNLIGNTITEQFNKLVLEINGSLVYINDGDIVLKI